MAFIFLLYKFRCCCGLPVTSHSVGAQAAFAGGSPPGGNGCGVGGGSLGALAEHLLSVPGGGGSSGTTSAPPVPAVPSIVPPAPAPEHWNPAKHTLARPTDAYGCIDFRGGTQTNKAQVSSQ